VVKENNKGLVKGIKGGTFAVIFAWKNRNMHHREEGIWPEGRDMAGGFVHACC
jgi:hypothetical protein